MTPYQKNIYKNIELSGEASTFFAEYQALKIKEWLPDLVDKPISILDFGCADGIVTSFLKQIFSNAQVYGVDPDRESIEVAHMAFPDITFLLSGTTIPMPDQQSDLIIACGVFHHIPRAEHDAYMQEIKRVLKPSGTFIMFELNPFNPFTRYRFKRNPLESNAHMLSAYYSRKLLQKYYGSVTTNYCYSFPVHPSKGSELGRFQFLEPYLTKVPFGQLYACIARTI